MKIIYLKLFCCVLLFASCTKEASFLIKEQPISIWESELKNVL
jgi:hypothetical protein